MIIISLGQKILKVNNRSLMLSSLLLKRLDFMLILSLECIDVICQLCNLSSQLLDGLLVSSHIILKILILSSLGSKGLSGVVKLCFNPLLLLFNLSQKCLECLLSSGVLGSEVVQDSFCLSFLLSLILDISLESVDLGLQVLVDGCHRLNFSVSLSCSEGSLCVNNQLKVLVVKGNIGELVFESS